MVMNSPAKTTGITLFETAIGDCGIAWGDGGITAATLPHARPDLTLAALRRRAPGSEDTPPPEVEQAIELIQRLLAGEAVDLHDVVLDMEGLDNFDRRVADVARAIAPGETLTYGDVAKRAGAPGEAREVGAAMGRNRFAPIVPCHRVVAAGGKLGGFSAPGGVETKLRMLEIERGHAPGPLSLFEAA
jgi:methylated-DNA-[protein]-cysteine S-methyltransferase